MAAARREMPPKNHRGMPGGVHPPWTDLNLTGNLRDLYAALSAAYPAMTEHLETNVSVSIDGRIYTEALFEPIGPENEVVLLPRISGG